MDYRPAGGHALVPSFLLLPYQTDLGGEQAGSKLFKSLERIKGILRFGVTTNSTQRWDQMILWLDVLIGSAALELLWDSNGLEQSKT